MNCWIMLMRLRTKSESHQKTAKDPVSRSFLANSIFSCAYILHSARRQSLSLGSALLFYVVR